MTKEEIIEKVLKQQKIIKWVGYFRRAMSVAMDEYAKQQAIAFAEYAANYGEKGPVGAWSEHHWQGNILAGEPQLTTEELYEQFLKENTDHPPSTTLPNSSANSPNPGL
jgi:hypothetical protein